MIDYPKNITRFPRPWPDEDKLAALDKDALVWINRGRRANIEAGRRFLEIKRFLRSTRGHGHWKMHFAEKFETRGIKLRTAQEWMAMARKRENAESALSASASDSHAERVRDATEAAKHEEGYRRKEEKRVLDKEFTKLTSELLRLPSWPAARLVVKSTVQQLRTKPISNAKHEKEKGHANVAA
jgi:hypothetical protein